jgi:hypothetical protein
MHARFPEFIGGDRSPASLAESGCALFVMIRTVREVGTRAGTMPRAPVLEACLPAARARDRAPGAGAHERDCSSRVSIVT